MTLADNSALFIVCYLLCGVSDVLDGYIARRYKLETKLGEKLDSLGDIAFWAAVLIALALRTGVFTKSVVIGVCVIAVHRAANLLITRLRFKQWGMLHSWGNKITGLLLYMLLPVCVMAENAARPAAILLFSTAFLSSLDETAILLSAEGYNANRKNYFIPD